MTTDAPQSFAFVDDGRTFTCSCEAMPRTRDDWWWFVVSTEANQRYAPFRAETTDTEGTVRLRVVEYYDHLLVRRAEPWRGRWPNGRRPTPTGETVAVTATVDASADVASE